jgi:hypothetical protein
MYIGHIAGLASLPFGVILLLNTFGFTSMDKFFGLPILLLASLGIIATELGDIIDSHLTSEHVILTWIIGIILTFPALIYFLSFVMAMPEYLTTPLPIIIGSFIFVEGLSSFFIGD